MQVSMERKWKEIVFGTLELYWFVEMPSPSSFFKGTVVISPQAHARVDKKLFEIVGPTFSTDTSVSLGICFHLFGSRLSSES